MSELLARIANLCRFRGGPQDLPHNPRLLIVLLAASIILDLTTANLLDIGDDALARSLFSTTLLLALCWLALAIRGLLSRYVQTAIALVGCSMVFSVLIIPLAWLFGTPENAEAVLSPAQTLIAWLGLGVLVWKITVDAHNVRQAIDAPFWLGFSLALAWAVADFALSRILFATPV
ncbi:MAG: hypothetical protein IPP82_07945 [Xanthomonadales bacterium]|nr:hypothetical protein [Xanthomonadales bacterium]